MANDSPANDQHLPLGLTEVNGHQSEGNKVRTSRLCTYNMYAYWKRRRRIRRLLDSDSLTQKTSNEHLPRFDAVKFRCPCPCPISSRKRDASASSVPTSSSTADCCEEHERTNVTDYTISNILRWVGRRQKNFRNYMRNCALPSVSAFKVRGQLKVKLHQNLISF